MVDTSGSRSMTSTANCETIDESQSYASQLLSNAKRLVVSTSHAGSSVAFQSSKPLRELKTEWGVLL